MRAKVEELPVIFRVVRGELLALFPTLPYDAREAARGGYPYITCYAHIGQHGEALRSYTQAGRLATPEEYAPLLAELRRIYETSHAPEDPAIKLRVVKRRPVASN